MNDEIRAHVHAMWAAVADGWDTYADENDERGAHVSQLMLDRVALARGERVLELACGPGGTCGNGLEKIYPSCAVRYGYGKPQELARFAPDYWIDDLRALATRRAVCGMNRANQSADPLPAGNVVPAHPARRYPTLLPPSVLLAV